MSDISLLSTHKNSKFGQLILRKMIKIGATRCQILSTKFDFGCLLQTPLGELTALPQTPYSWIKRSYF